MNKWRYKIEVVKISMWSKVAERADTIQEKLSRLGMEGWELVNVVSFPNSYTVTLYLKRSY